MRRAECGESAERIKRPQNRTSFLFRIHWHRLLKMATDAVQQKLVRERRERLSEFRRNICARSCQIYCIYKRNIGFISLISFLYNCQNATEGTEPVLQMATSIPMGIVIYRRKFCCVSKTNLVVCMLLRRDQLKVLAGCSQYTSEWLWLDNFGGNASVFRAVSIISQQAVLRKRRTIVICTTKDLGYR